MENARMVRIENFIENTLREFFGVLNGEERICSELGFA